MILPTESIPIHQKQRVNKNRYDNAILDRELKFYKIAGKHKQTNDYCGSFDSAYTTESKQKIVVRKNDCDKLSCKICHKTVARRRARDAGVRLNAYRLGSKRAPRHFSFHPNYNMDEAEFSLKFKKLRTSLYRIIKESGIMGGVCILHTERINQSNELYFSPHWHIIGFGFILNAKKFKEKYGFTYRNHQRNDNGKAMPLSKKTLNRVLKYTIDHSTQMNDRHSITYFGTCGYRNMTTISRKIEYVEQENDECETYYRIKRECLNIESKMGLRQEVILRKIRNRLEQNTKLLEAKVLSLSEKNSILDENYELYLRYSSILDIHIVDKYFKLEILDGTDFLDKENMLVRKVITTKFHIKNLGKFVVVIS